MSIVDYVRRVIDIGQDPSNHDQVITCVDKISRDVVNSDSMVNLKHDLERMNVDELVSFFGIVDAEMLIPEVVYHRAFLLFCVLSSILEQRRSVDKHPLLYEPGRASESEYVEDVLLMNNLGQWDESIVQRLSEQAIRVKDKICIMTAVYLVGIWIWSNKVKCKWLPKWMHQLHMECPSGYDILVSHPQIIRYIDIN